MLTMASEPHTPRIDATTGYWFTRWYDASGKRIGKTFGHSSKVARRQVIQRYREWLLEFHKGATKKHTGNSVAALIEGYNEHAQIYYRRADGTLTGEHTNIEYALKPLNKMIGKLDAAAIRPRHLKDYIAIQIEDGAMRTTINKRIGIVKRMYRWAVGEEFVPAEVYGALAVVQSIEKGRTEAEEPERVEAVSMRDLVKTIRHLDPIVETMIRLQWLTGMRPGEICGLTPSEIDRTAKTWIYRPAKHKTAHKGKIRVVAFGPKSRAILSPYLFREAEAACFSPRESRRWWNNQRQSSHKKAGKAVYSGLGEQFTTKTYGDAIERATIKAGVPVWTPNQIRHAAATREDRWGGKDAAQRLLGHTDSRVTEVYIDENIRALMERAERAG